MLHALKNKSVRSSAKQQREVATFNVLMTFLIVINVINVLNVEKLKFFSTF